MNGVQIAGVISIVLCLILAWGNLQSHGLSLQSKLRMALVWVAIIIGLTLAVTAFSA